MKTINDFIKELQSISEEKRKLPLIIDCSNGIQAEPVIKMRFKDDDFMSGNIESMVITWNDY